MTNPTILQLLQKADCRYTLVVEVSKRARQLVGGAQPLIDTKETKPVSIAIDEVNRGLISYERPAELNDLGE
ncbi:MAG TPA: DNA-directed RNA polymerase subunit omega [Candidatus Onthenecus intestinigallinarum]|uniref:DNA-directed RNA polymerase subunit omega n=1 Tax=Candidatus Onthenecus intestinigallinarum TaxID=2840875 RepID=A0A9D1CSG3_9FIRM|nr:DNA-directed RNA polymerase subunit omega [Candidatus Onthenecus intestinigallinarum]